MRRTDTQEISDQGFVDGIIRGLYSQLDDHADYREVMLACCINMLCEIAARGSAGLEAGDPFMTVIKTINAEAKSEAERRYLALLVFEKMFVSVKSGICFNLAAEELRSSGGIAS